MSIDTEWQLAGWFQLIVALGLPVALLLTARRWRFWVRLVVAVVIAWVAGVFVQVFISPVNEAHYLAHYHHNPANLDDYDPQYNDVAINGLVLCLGWLPPLFICLLVAGVSRLVRSGEQHPTT